MWNFSIFNFKCFLKQHFKWIYFIIQVDPFFPFHKCRNCRKFIIRRVKGYKIQHFWYLQREVIKVACVSNNIIPEITTVIWRSWSSWQTDTEGRNLYNMDFKKAKKCLKCLLYDDRNPYPSASTALVNRFKKKRQGQTPRDHNDDVERRRRGHPHEGMIGVSPTMPQFEAPREQTQMASVPWMYLQCCGGKLLTRCRPGLDPHREDDGRSDDVSQSQQSGAAPSS